MKKLIYWLSEMIVFLIDKGHFVENEKGTWYLGLWKECNSFGNYYRTRNL